MSELDNIEERLRKVKIVAPVETHVGIKQLQEDCVWLVVLAKAQAEELRELKQARA
jgi:hypothetical protein